mmetsp:Transcript_17579/g.26640  ORF Transcript_17579/g.26640 Transcript_17579/m.26640 type:complete len:391 (-) Transcript_17579:66-1238(-)
MTGESFDLAFDPQDVRKVVKEAFPEAKEIATQGEQVLSFLVGMHSKDTLQRFNIYIETGTVGCASVMNEEYRESFRRNLTSTDALAKALRDPPKHARLDDGLGEENNAIGARDLTHKIELAEVGVCILMAERDKLTEHAKSLEGVDHGEDDDTEYQSDDGTECDSDDANTMAGLEFDYSLNEDVLLQTDQCLEDIAKMGKQVNSVSTNGKACVFLYGNGGIAYTPNVPKPLYSKLQSLRTNPKATRPAYIALGTRDRYHVSFLNGTFDWKGSKSLGQVLKKLRHPPRCVAFGPSYDTFFIIYHDGSWEYQGRSIPPDLIKKLHDREERPDLVCVTLGPRGEWFLRTENGRLWWGGISDELDELVESLLESDRYLNFLDFGDDGSYFLSYD